VGRTLLSAAVEFDFELVVSRWSLVVGRWTLVVVARGYRFNKSTAAFTSCTRKYFASAGCFFATASYIA
jgi:hypothetical protein